MVWERLWPALLPMLMVAASFAAVSMFDLWFYLPGLVHLALLAGFLCAFCVALVAGLRTLRLPRHGDVNRRIEQDSALTHRPLETLEDRQSTPGPTGATGAILWQLHQKRAAEDARRARGVFPRPDMPKKDPFALRWAVGLFVLAAVVFAGPGDTDRYARAFDPQFGFSAPTPMTVDAWVTPPEYTGLAPIFLSSGSDGAPERTDAGPVSLPEGSVFTLRIQGARAKPDIRLRKSGADEAQSLTADVIDGVEGGFEVIHILDRNLSIEMAVGPETARVWQFAVRPDDPPEVDFSEDVGVTSRLALRFVYQAEDDYGVEGIEATIALDVDGATAPPILLPLPLRGLSPKSVTGQAFRDFTPHPFAGLPVNITLTAVDAPGQEGRSRTMKMVMPERAFTNLVARALIEQRKILTLSPEKTSDVARVLEAITIYPGDLFESVAPLLGISAVVWELRIADMPGGRDRAVELLWEIALALEDGDLSLAFSELRAAQQALQNALERGASDAEIQQLTQDLRDAMNRYLEAMTAQAMERMKNSPQSFTGQSLDPENMVRSDELQRMLDDIENMARSGARDAAQQMLSELQNMLENLQAGIPQQLDPNQALMGEALKELSDMIARQQQLMDQTLQESQDMQNRSQSRPNGQNNGQRRPDGKPGERAQGGRQPGDGEELSQAQEALRRALGNLMSQLGEADADLPSALGRAEQAMRRSRNALRQGQSGEALAPQRDALDQMREGAQSLAEQLMNAMRQNQPGSGEGEATAQGQGKGGKDRDPLGRPRAQSGADTGDSVKVPGQRSVQTVREILRELRRRASERQRPKPELDYLKRLLERF